MCFSVLSIHTHRPIIYAFYLVANEILPLCLAQALYLWSLVLIISHFDSIKSVSTHKSFLFYSSKMCQASSSSISRRESTLIASKGFLVGATAVAAFFVLEDFVSTGDSAASLRGGSNTTSTIDPTLPNNSSDVEHSNLPKIDVQKLAAPIGNANEASYVPSAAPSTPIPTYIPTAAGEIPTDMPTQFHDDIISSSLAKTRANKETGFRLKMYWETGYYWQEITTEKFWCMACPSGEECNRNDKMELRNCNNKSNEDAQFVATPVRKGHQFRIANTNLCLQKSRRGSAIRLKPCNAKNKWQHFVGLKSDGKRFNLKPSTSSKRCLSQHHHPKKGEIIYAETCYKAHRVDTGYWVKY
mmetsp:Transcript_15146/g.23470  ORF Transcript_15146/g.23470 Transcript_15146/m.23470 type:complete len:356 (-) Transcript_15146:1976-3043(-)